MAKIEGFEQLARRLKTLDTQAQARVIKRAVTQSTTPVVRAARDNAPVGNPPYESGDPYPKRTYLGNLRTPGFLKRSIARKTIVHRDGSGVSVLIGAKPEAWYGPQLIELGTSSIPKQPWLVPALRSNLRAVDARLVGRLRKILDKATRA